MASFGDSSFELRGVGIDLLRALVTLANGINPDPDYWTIGRVGALLVGNHEILAAGNRWGVDEGEAGEAAHADARRALLSD